MRDQTGVIIVSGAKMSVAATTRLISIDTPSSAIALRLSLRRVSDAQIGARPSAKNGIAGTECRGPTDAPPSQ